MSTGINCGQVRGPVQFAFARSVEPILPLEIAITRMAATNAIHKAKDAVDFAYNAAGATAIFENH